MDIQISKKDIVWAYAAQIFGIGAGLITLPLILNRLSPEEVGMNYLLLMITSISSLLDLGFVVQFGRNITYVLSGADSLQKEGVRVSTSSVVNLKLLATIIDTAKYVYKKMSFAILIGLLTLGSLYMYNATKGFTLVDNSQYIWLIFCISIYFEVYFKYIQSLLNGAAMITESRKAIVYSKLVYIAISYTMLLLGFGLISVVIANFISPFINRIYCYRCFYEKIDKNMLDNYHSTKAEIRNIFDTIWNTTKMLALNAIGSFASNYVGMFFAGMFLSLSQLSSYGLMLQLFNILSALSINLNNTYQPIFCKNRVTGNFEQIKKDLSLSVVVALLVNIIGSVAILILSPWALVLIKSQSVLPSIAVMVIYSVYSLLHSNMVSFCTYITTGNSVPFVNPSLITAIAIIILTFILLYLGTGIYGPVISVFIAELLYNTWKWPKYVIRSFDMNLFSFYKIGFNEIINKSKTLCQKQFILA